MRMHRQFRAIVVERTLDAAIRVLDHSAARPQNILGIEHLLDERDGLLSERYAKNTPAIIEWHTVTA
jgi:hypothetical protein